MTGQAISTADIRLPAVEVACTGPNCPAAGAGPRRVHLRPAAPGFVEMPVLLCTLCGRQARVVRPWPMEEDMPKITVHGGPSNAALPEREYVPGKPLPELPPEKDAERLALAPVEEEPSPGTSSSPSSAKPETKPQQSAPRRRSRARTTANRSKTDPTGSSSARSTGGDQTEPTSAAEKD
jgi:hypothetical protein